MTNLLNALNDLQEAGFEANLEVMENGEMCIEVIDAELSEVLEFVSAELEFGYSSVETIIISE